MNLFLRRLVSVPQRAEDLDQFAPDAFITALAVGLDTAAAEFDRQIGATTNDQIGRCLRHMQAEARTIRPLFLETKADAPSRDEDVFAAVRHILGVGMAVADDPVMGGIEAILSTIENAEAARRRMKQTREAATRYGAGLLDLSEAWLNLLVQDVMPPLNGDFQRARLP